MKNTTYKGRGRPRSTDKMATPRKNRKADALIQLSSPATNQTIDNFQDRLTKHLGFKVSRGQAISYAIKNVKL